MRRYFAIILITLTMFSLCACKQDNTEFNEPVTFFYCCDVTNESVSDDTFHNVFVAEIREGSGYKDDLPSLLTLYLQGPHSEELVSPFPTGLRVVSAYADSERVLIVFSDAIDSLTGLDLTIACSCLALTVFDSNECDYIEIAAETKPLDEQESIVITRDSLVLADDTYSFSKEG